MMSPVIQVGSKRF